MVKRNYIISGITVELAAQLGSEFRKDLKLFIDENGKVLAKISLTRIGAIVMRTTMILHNIKHGSTYKLKRCKGKHFRV